MTKNVMNEIEDALEQKTAELKKHPDFDPRKEKELDELYAQYVPPHSLESRSHLLDAAERDAYIDPIPPIGSRKMAGAFLKKVIRVAIGWYIQFVTQQISTFGSSVAQALRSLNHDVEKIKDKLSVGDKIKYHETLNLTPENNDIFIDLLKDLNQDELCVVSDGISSEALKHIDANVTVVDPRIKFVSQYEPTLDTRVEDILTYLDGIEANKINTLILHGRIINGDINSRLNVIEKSKRALKENGEVVVIVPKKLTTDLQIYFDLTNSTLWSENTWIHLLKQAFGNVDTKELDEAIVLKAKKEISQ